MGMREILKGTVIYESGQKLNGLMMIMRGTAVVSFEGGSYELHSGDVIGLPDLIHKEANFRYVAKENLAVVDYPSKVSELKDGYSDNGAGLEPWSSGNITTNMTLNKPYTFTVIAENGSRKEYTIMLSYPTEKPVLKAGTVTRSSDKEAKAVFNSTLAGKYYWEIVEKGAKEPTIDTSYAGSTAKKGNNTVTLTSLEAGAKDLYIVVKSSDGEVSDLLKMEIPAYDAAAEEYAITLSYPTSGGTLKASASKAKAGDKITITVTPKTGYKLTPGTLKYSESW